MKTKKIVLLHSNDIHGDILAEMDKGSGNMIGGLALMSGYIKKVRKEEENVIFVISGDMLQGSIIDSEYKGIFTIEIINFLSPDVVTLGNHEFDYGLGHLLLLEKMATFPIVNANLYLSPGHGRLMKPYYIIKKDGIKIFFSGVLTAKTLETPLIESLLKHFVYFEDELKSVKNVITTYRKPDINLTCLLTHIGLPEDEKLAAQLKPSLGVDLIIGGHSHTLLKKPKKINNILISQVGKGTDHIGRYDITFDQESGKVLDYKWKLIPINNKIAKPDPVLFPFIKILKEKIEKKYNKVISKSLTQLTHPDRTVETSLGNLIADAVAASTNSDIALIGSGAIRIQKMGPVIKLMDLEECLPFINKLSQFIVSGKELIKIFKHIMKPANRLGTGECYQVSKSVKAIYDDKKKKLKKLSINGKPIKDNSQYTLVLQDMHVTNCKKYLNIAYSKLTAKKDEKFLAMTTRDMLETYLLEHKKISSKVEGRLVYE